MAILNSVKQLLLGGGNPTEYQKLEAQNVPINATTTFALTGFINPITNGRWRYRLTAAGAAGQTTAIKVTITDGVTTEAVDLYGTFAVADIININGQFVTDLQVTTVSILVTKANLGAADTADMEVTGNP